MKQTMIVIGGLSAWFAILVRFAWWETMPGLLPCVIVWALSALWLYAFIASASSPWSLLSRWTVAIGLPLNATVTIANGGLMPVVGMTDDAHSIWVPATEAHVFLALADHVQYWGLSIGDGFIFGGIALAILGWAVTKARTSLTAQVVAQTASIAAITVLLSGCITPHKEVNGQYTKPAKTEERSVFGTNHGFARLERCDVEKEPWFFWFERDFKNCRLLTAAEQAEWEGDQSRGAGPEIVGAAIVGGSIGAGVAASGGAKATATGSATAVNIANQAVNVKGRR